MNKLTIKTDLADTKWLKYILVEFKRINLAKFDIEIKNINEKINYQANILYYTKI